MKICSKQDLSCDQCDYKTKSDNLLEIHRRKHNKKKELCDICGYEAKTKAKLNHHKEKKHGPGTEPHRQCATIHNCGYCNYGSRIKCNVEKHELVCKVRKRHETRIEDIPIVQNKELGELFAETRSSEKDFNKIVHFFHEKCPEMFESRSFDAVKKYCESLDWLHESTVLEFRDSNGKEFLTTMGKVADVPDFIREICIGKGIDIDKVQLVVSCDAGQGTL